MSSTATKTRGLIFPDRDVLAMLDGRKSRTMRLIGGKLPIVEAAHFQPGDWFYVKEAWFDWGRATVYRAGSPGSRPSGNPDYKWKSATCMNDPRARLWARIDSVAVQRPCDLTEEECIAEGCQPSTWGPWWQGYRDVSGVLIHCQCGGESPPDWMVEPKPYRMSATNKTAKQEFSYRLLSIKADTWEQLHWVYEFTLGEKP